MAKTDQKILYNSFQDNQDCVCSVQRCFCFFFLLLFLLLIILGAFVAIVVFLLKPKRPQFSMDSFSLDSYTLEAKSSSDICFSSNLSLGIIARNPNMVGIKYGPSEFSILFQGLPIGVAKIPAFYQHAHSEKMHVHSQVVLHHLNLHKMFIKGFMEEFSKGHLVDWRLVGDIEAGLRLWGLTFPKVAIDCIITVAYKGSTSNKTNNTLLSIEKVVFNSFPKITQICQVAPYI
ncbi:uncharacterized protein LOC110006795 isoform X2 [Amborella trichopoda]|uniref:uncharacterized protein LOC110006795 isoform X2 n=1 Tax=Amborella trichopoda TaxID=13333 RepID=UPI0009BFD9C1|nr:uncharacterized protein LOC110006795 isoform X2 [Amborella trichopoda]|eukprot:XP_020519679.1 uncharacterized protein LOC110006795 isoform X2 [Amborella trichopoda]